MSLAKCSGDPAAKTTTVGDPAAKSTTVTSPAVNPPAVKFRKKAKKIYWGAQIGEQFTGEAAPWDMKATRKFQRKAGKPLSLLGFSGPFVYCGSSGCSYVPFPTTPLDNARRYGAIPFFSWSSASSPISIFQDNFQLSDVINGRHDAFIREFARDAKAWGHPFFLRFNWEMNGNWNPWSEQRNGNKRGQYVAAWRHVHDIFTSAGATNVNWVWCPNVDFLHQFPNIRGYYPGGRYVDWTCLDGFNWGKNPANPGKWRSFRTIFRPSYRKVKKIAPGKPIIIGEVASSSKGGSKAHWIRDMLREIPASFRKIRGFVWFDTIDRGIDWPIENSRSATRAFRKGISRPAYRKNVYGNLSGNKINPPH